LNNFSGSNINNFEMHFLIQIPAGSFYLEIGQVLG
jgi:hypothetical protein